MAHIEKTVFISYRRTTVAWTLNIYQNLTKRMGLLLQLELISFW